MFRSKFTSAVSVNLSQLSTLLCDLSESWETGEDWENGRRCEVWKLLEVVGVVGGLDKSKGDYCTHCRVLANVLFSIFNYVTKSSISLQQGAHTRSVLYIVGSPLSLSLPPSLPPSQWAE